MLEARERGVGLEERLDEAEGRAARRDGELRVERQDDLLLLNWSGLLLFGLVWSVLMMRL